MARRASAPRVNEAFDAGNYLWAAKEHAAALASLYERGDYVLAIYSAGLSAECLFRAYRQKRGLPFTSDHKLSNLASEARFAELIPEHKRTTFDAAITNLIVSWRNNHRFRSLESLRRFLKDARLDRGIRGDYLKSNARQITSSAYHLVALGVQRWKN